MQIGKLFYPKTRQDFRNWLEKNHDKEKEIWIKYYKKTTGIQTITYDEAVEEALCFGWIDSIVKGIDEKSFAGRFTPRKLNSNLSASNINRVKSLIKQGKMTKAGLDILKGCI